MAGSLHRKEQASLLHTFQFCKDRQKYDKIILSKRTISIILAETIFIMRSL